MDFYEFIQKTKDVDLKELGVFIGSNVHKEDSVSCWRNEDGSWTLLMVDDRQKETVIKGEEKEVLDILYGNVRIRQRVL